MSYCNYYGGADQIWTGDLFLTKEVHYLCATEPFNKTPGIRRSPEFDLVGDKGLEPLREHMILSHARLPIPPIPHNEHQVSSTTHL